MEGEVISLQDIFRYDHAQGRLVATGIRPDFSDRLSERGIELARHVVRRRVGSMRRLPRARRSSWPPSPAADPVAPAAGAPATPANFEVMLVVDTSGSMEGAPIQTARTAAQQFVAQMPADVRIGVESFGRASPSSPRPPPIGP